MSVPWPVAGLIRRLKLCKKGGNGSRRQLRERAAARAKRRRRDKRHPRSGQGRRAAARKNQTCFQVGSKEKKIRYSRGVALAEAEWSLELELT